MTSSGTYQDCEPVRLSLGAFVLGALAPDEAIEVSRHVAGCPDCTREYDELAGVADLLAMIGPAEAEALCCAPPPDPPSDRTTVVHGAGAGRRARRRGPRRGPRRGRAVAVLLGLAVLAGAGGAVRSLTDRAPAHPVHVASATDAKTGVGASVSVEPVMWGSRLTLALRNAPLGSSCSLVVVGQHGERQVAASWTAKYGGTLTIPGAAAMQPGDISRFDVETFDGHRLVSVPE